MGKKKPGGNFGVATIPIHCLLSLVALLISPCHHETQWEKIPRWFWSGIKTKAYLTFRIKLRKAFSLKGTVHYYSWHINCFACFSESQTQQQRSSPCDHTITEEIRAIRKEERVQKLWKKLNISVCCFILHWSYCLLGKLKALNYLTWTIRTHLVLRTHILSANVLSVFNESRRPFVVQTT